MKKKKLLFGMLLSLNFTAAYAQVTDGDLTPGIYPFKPMKTEDVVGRTSRLTENEGYIRNIHEINRRGLTSANTKIQPWTGSYWPLNQGMIANNYQDKDYDTFITTLDQSLSWRSNVARYNKRPRKIHRKIYDLSEEKLSELSPAEKYDILLGDTNFDLTNRIWAYAEKWGYEKKWGFLSSIDLPRGYRIPDASELMALWEGICHGWATAAGHVPRPTRTIWVKLPNNKRMPIYPTDVKALISLLWANSTIQDAVIVEGLRCNKKYPAKDEFGRYIDTDIQTGDSELLPRCADVHPAVFHSSVVNITGIEGRSFVVDKSAKSSVSNQPVAGYNYKYFNPSTGDVGGFNSSVMAVEKYTDDPFRSSRNPETRFIVGVAMTLDYADWEFPKIESKQKLGHMEFDYDLELNANGDIIGGQWRVRKDGRPVFLGIGDTHQPDFFWVVPRDYKKFFTPVGNLPEWDFNRSTLPPKEYKAAALQAHSFVYQMTKEFGWNLKCPVFNERTGEKREVPCEFKYPRPQPLLQVVNKLIELSR